MHSKLNYTTKEDINLSLTLSDKSENCTNNIINLINNIGHNMIVNNQTKLINYAQKTNIFNLNKLQLE